MSELPFHHHDPDGSRYEFDVIRDRRDPDDPHYDVDLVRSSVNNYGLSVEQRLTLGEYPEKADAEVYRDEVEDTLAAGGLDALGDARERIAAEPYLHDGVYLTAVYPPDADAHDPAAVQLIAIGEQSLKSTTLATGERETLDPLLTDVDHAFAHSGADAGLDRAADLTTTPLFDEQALPEYYFGYGVSPDNEPSLEAVKTWMNGAERHFDTLTVGEYGSFDEAAVDERELETLLDEQGVEAAMNLAERMAVTGGYLDPDRDDPRIFFEDDAPSDPFTTERQRDLATPAYDFVLDRADDYVLELRAEKTWADGEDVGIEVIALREYDTDVPDHHIDGVRETAAMDREELLRVRDDDGLETAMRQAEGMAVELGTLEPERDDPRLFTQGPPDPFTTTRERELAGPEYSVGAVSANGESFLDVMKTWGEDDYERLVVPQPDWEMAREAAVRANDLLEQGQLEGAMQLVEDQGVAAGVIDPERDDPRLFTQGPPDPFTTMREEEIDDELARYGVTWRETQEWAQPTQPEPEAEMGNPYWRMETLPVNDPDGEPLGHSLHMVVYDGVEHDPEMVGTPAIPEDEPFRMLEMAHFETTEAADKFGKEFNGYLMPGLLEGPELAEEVARLEGHPVEWKMLEGQELNDYRDLKLKLTCDPVDWQPYNPNAERDARIEAEGLYTDPINQYTTFDEDEDDPKVEPASPDFDL